MKKENLSGGRYQLRYSKYIASSVCDIKKQPQQQMKELGYDVTNSVFHSMTDEWWFTVTKIIKPLPEYLKPVEYNYRYWHESCRENCEHYKQNSSCCFGGFNCKKEGG